jgi:4-coumarate--CoA ligase
MLLVSLRNQRESYTADRTNTVLCSGINPLATSFELEHYFQIARPSIIAVDASLLSNVQTAIKKLEISPSIIVIGHPARDVVGHVSIYPDSLDQRMDVIEPLDLTGRDNRSHPAAICFSSGTSGSPKGVVISHHNLLAQVLGLRSTNPFLHCARVREVFFPSFAHVYGLVSAVLMPAWVGSYMQILKRFDYLDYLRRCADIKATVLRLVPAVAVRMIKDPTVKQLDLTSVQAVMCSGAGLSDTTVEALKDMLALGAGVLNGYGMTEATVTLLRETRTDKGASVGRPAAGVSIRVVDDEMNDVQSGADGECLVRGPTVFLEYKDNPSATLEAKSRDGWLRTGDIVRVDTDGFFYLTGRKKELIKFRGNQIAPTELEAAVLLDSRVTDAGVCGVFDKSLDTEIPVAFVTLKDGTLLSPSERTRILHQIKQFVNERVAPYKRLRRDLVHMEALPKNASGKLLRRVLVTEATKLAQRRTKL